jgi:HK97 family phage major capsid protein
MNKSLIMPRAIMGSVRAEADPAKLFGELRETVSGFMDQHNSRLDNMETALNALTAGNSPLAQITPNMGPAPDQEYSRTFASYFRKGDGDQELRAANAIGQRAAIQAAMSVGDNSSGGYLAPVEWDGKISEAQRATSPLRRLATVVRSSVGAYTTLWNSDQHASGWVGEVAARPATSSSTLTPINFAAGEIYANPAVSQRLLDDAAINVEGWLINSLQREFSRQEAIAFISGSGVNQPAGFLTYTEGGVNEATHPGGPIDVTETAITVDALVDFSYGLAAPYRQQATFLMSSLTAAALTKLKDADGNLIWRESLIVGQPATLLGRPVAIDEGMPAPTAGLMPIAFGDFAAGYVINDRIGVRVLRDPYSNKPYVMFYATKRVGGGVLDVNAIRVLKVPA